MYRYGFLLALIVAVMIGCTSSSEHLFLELSPQRTGVKFVNKVEETETLNILNLEYFYNGGGVAVGDFNRDGLEDLYFTANLADNHLYLNKGNFKFKDVTAASGVAGRERWKSGVAVVDINGDGWLDIYVCATIAQDSLYRRNLLFINQGLNEDGIPTFKEEAAQYGVDNSSYSSNALFFDYDRDGDLDLYILTNSKQHNIPVVYREKVNDGTAENTDILMRNNGDGTFTDVSEEAGIRYEGFGLGVATCDINKDGWIDLYVSNDFLSNDLLYLNRGGKFENVIDKMIKHQSRFSMGNDIADINNDGEPDIITLDMLPEDNLRKKTVMGGNGYINYINDQRYGYAHQFTRNMLQVNNGDGTFSEIGMLAGIYQTEWSWSPLFVDLDNDGYRDLLITNGYPKDITDKDFVNFRQKTNFYTDQKTLLSEVPSVKVKNYIYRNNGDLTFTNVSEAWGIENISFSNGAAFVDLDNDGDLDYVVNNINDPASIYENTLYGKGKNLDTLNHFLEIRLNGLQGNTLGLGSKIWIKYEGGQMQYHDHSIYRGYISSVDPTIHFGLGKAAGIDSLLIIWPDGKGQLLLNIPANQEIEINQDQAQILSLSGLHPTQETPELFTPMNKALSIDYKQPMYDFIDFNIQRNIPHKFTENIPGLAIGDVNGDGLEDFVIGNYKHQNLMLFKQDPKGQFTAQVLVDGKDKPEIDEGLLLLDVDGDQDLDLYVVSGGFADSIGHDHYRDRLYLNDGAGRFTEQKNALPDIKSNGLVVRAADIDGDGDLDLFVGARVLPGSYPLADQSYLLRNDRGIFSDVTNSWAPALSKLGMVTDAVWSDYNNDNIPDLIVVGEFMPIQVFKNDGKKLEKVTSSGLEQYSGWWNSIVPGDFDRDGDMDYAVGNLGNNNTYQVSADHPLKAFSLDIDKNNSEDVVLACFLKFPDGHYDLCPVNQWEELFSQSPVFRKRFAYHREFGMANMDSLLTPEERANATVLEANYVLSSVLLNQGDGTFKVEAMPLLAQVAPVNGMRVYDVNQDAIPDLLLVGNDYSNEVFSGTLDALNGLVLIGKGNGQFDAVKGDCGFRVPGAAKALGLLTTETYDVFLATQNKDSVLAFTPVLKLKTIQLFTPKPEDQAAVITYNDGGTQRVEFNYGAGMLTQSSRRLRITAAMKLVEVINRKGESRIVIDAVQ